MSLDCSLICRHIQGEIPFFQYLTPSLREDNDGRGSSSHKAALSAHRGRCGDVVTVKAGCVSKQELPALWMAALALRRYYSSSSYLSTDYLCPYCFSRYSLHFFLNIRQLLSPFPYHTTRGTAKIKTEICRTLIHVAN